MNIRRLIIPSPRKLLLVVLILAVAVIGIWYKQGNKPKPIAEQTITYSTDQPSEDPIDKTTYNWSGNNDDPKYIELPTIGASSFIQKVGVDQNQQVAVPNNIYLAGWFTSSVKPGQKGLSIIDGHVNGRIKSDGVFFKLANLKAGETFTVELGNSLIIKYEVIGVTSVPAKDAPNFLFSQDPTVASQLNLITCAGEFDTTSKTYNERVIVSSKLIN